MSEKLKMIEVRKDGDNVLISVDGRLVLSMGGNVIYAYEDNWDELGITMEWIKRCQ